MMIKGGTSDDPVMSFHKMDQGDMPTGSETTPLNCRILPSHASRDRSTYESLNDNPMSNEAHAGSMDVDSNPSHKSAPCMNINSKSLRIIPAILILVAPFIYMVVNIADSSSIPPVNTKPAIVGSLNYSRPKPFSKLDPVYDLQLFGFDRNADTSPPLYIQRPNPDAAVPTNEWYQNLLIAHEGTTELQRVYAVPYMVDLAGPIAGLQIHPNHIDASSNVIQLSYVIPHGLTLGAAENSKHATSINVIDNEYSVVGMTPLGISLKWNASDMSSSIVRGMSYMTMNYSPSSYANEISLPTIASHGPLRGTLLLDGHISVPCDSSKHRVEREILMTFENTDFTWIAFFSEPVSLHCVNAHPSWGGAALQFVPHSQDDAVELVARVALVTNCTSGMNPLYCREFDRTKPAPTNEAFIDLLRRHANAYPGSETKVQYHVDHEHDHALLTFDWDVQQMTPQMDDEEPVELISFALLHHIDFLGKNASFCRPVMLGRACVVVGSTWSIPHTLPPASFRAGRPPKPEVLPALSAALHTDFQFRMPEYFMRGVGDTYFSGKILAKIARLLLIAEEVIDLCSQPSATYADACRNSTLPTVEEVDTLLDVLRSGVEIWINGTAEAPFLYDKGWGGLVNCGCLFHRETQSCLNTFPDCPAFEDQGLNFGNGFYNDHHFHYGYHIYAAAVVAKFDPNWGRAQFEGVNLLIRDFANPSPDDYRFPMFRQKDWFEGHSWASGIPLPAYLNGRNQESSSEAIAAYEAVALFGSVMLDAWNECPNCIDSTEHAEVAGEIRDVGRLLLATEIRSTDRYWHVRLKNETLAVFPKPYTQNVVGMLWNTMAQFQTWFGNAPYLPYGIQLLPITAISEQRDDPKWLEEMYHPFADACNQNTACESDGWSVLQLSVLASVGHFDKALQRVQALAAEVFESAGGNGHSRSNTLWYISTRPDVTPIVLPASEAESTNDTSVPDDQLFALADCGVPETCTAAILDTSAGGFTCRERINWLIQTMGKSQSMACEQVGGLEFPTECGGCQPSASVEKSITIVPIDTHCPPCTDQICSSVLNRCPVYERTFLCTKGPSMGGCQDEPWPVEPQCIECCETTECPKKAVVLVKTVIDPSTCPTCAPDVCRKSLCPLDVDPYFCEKGHAMGGCAPRPWDLSTGDCNQCCTVTEECRRSARGNETEFGSGD